MKRLIVLTVLVGCSWQSVAQTVWGADPHVTASAADGGLVLQWNALADAGLVTIYRQPVGATAASLLAVLDAGTISYGVEQPVGQRVAYRVLRNQPGGYGGETWIVAGDLVPFRDDQGAVVVVIDQTNEALLRLRLDEFENDLRDDGFDVVEVVTARGSLAPALKAQLVAAKQQWQGRLRAVVFLGAVPRALSGLQNPDGHPDHYGAWAADPYYADLDGTFTDTFVGGTGAFANDAGDGRFDQSTTPTVVDVAVGRIDFEGMPQFGADAGTRLLAAYFDKVHDYRSGAVVVTRQAVSRSSFGYFGGEAFQRAGYRDGTAILGTEPLNVSTADFFPTLVADAGVLLTWADGAGGPTSVAGALTTTDLTTVQLRTRFLGLFGSYFGDWNYQNDVMRAALGSGLVTHSLWFARPTVFLHALGSLESFGDAFARTQALSFRSMPIYQALLGDPTLRLFYPARLVGTLATSVKPASVELQWSAGTATGLLGYHVFRKRQGDLTAPVRLTANPVTLTTFIDATVQPDTSYEWRVVPVVKEKTGSGTFFNHGLGIRAVATTASAPIDAGTDAGEADAGAPDAGATDAGTDDAGTFELDASVDSGTEADGGTDDAGVDAGEREDAGNDAGFLDQPDAGLLEPMLPVQGSCGCTSAPALSLALLALVARTRRRRT